MIVYVNVNEISKYLSLSSRRKSTRLQSMPRLNIITGQGIDLALLRFRSSRANFLLLRYPSRPLSLLDNKHQRLSVVRTDLFNEYFTRVQISSDLSFNYCAVTVTVNMVEAVSPVSGIPLTSTRYSPMAASRAAVICSWTSALSLALITTYFGVTLIPSVLT